MMETTILGFKIKRLLLDYYLKIDEAEEEVKRTLGAGFSYVFVISYHRLNLPDLSMVKKITPLIYLSQSLDEIFSKFNKTTRNEIRKTAKMPELKFVRLDKNLSGSYKFYKKIKQKDGAVPELKRDFVGCKFFNAYLNGKMVVSMSCWDNGRVLRLKSIVSLRKEYEYESKILACASRRLIWEICNCGKEEGHKVIDLGGINFAEPSKSGITQFKQSFSGTVIDTFIYRYESRLFKIVKKLFKLFGRNIN